MDLARLVTRQPDFGPYIVEKLWRAFVSDQPDPAEISRLATRWRDAGLEIRPLLRALFLTDAFWDPANRGRLVKSPVEMMVGTIRALGLEGVDLAEANWMLEEMGQALFLPPNVAGWPEGTGWINDRTATARAAALTEILHGTEPADPRAPMMTPETRAPQVAEGALRIGQPFLVMAETHAEGTGFVVTFYDLGFHGAAWRSISLWAVVGAGGRLV